MIITGGRVKGLPQLRVWVRTPSARTWFRLMEADAFSLHAPDIVREHICEERRPGVYAQWADPREPR